jgi:sulfoacetaldehyde dehydrogenase
MRDQVNIPMSQALMARADLIVATGGQQMVGAAYGSGTPAYGVGAGNSTMIIDETANLEEAACNTRLSKTSDYGSGCSADGNLIIEASIFDKLVKQLQVEGGYLASDAEKAALRKVMWDAQGLRTSDTVAISPQKLARAAGFAIPADRKFIMVHGDGIGEEHPFCGEKLTTLLAVYKYKGFDQALDMMRGIYDVGGKGHSCGIYSFDQGHIHRLALAAPVSRIMVRQPQSKANAGAFNNGMPMTSSLGCGTWGGNIVSENVHLKHYMNTTWVSVPIKEGPAVRRGALRCLLRSGIGSDHERNRGGVTAARGGLLRHYSTVIDPSYAVGTFVAVRRPSSTKVTPSTESGDTPRLSA